VPAASIGRRRSRQPLGIYAFIAAAGAAAAIVIWMVLFMGWIVQNVGPEMLESTDPAEQQRAGQELLLERGHELQQFALFPATASIAGLLAVALAVVSLVRNDCSKAWPILAIIIGVLALALGCCGLLTPLAAQA